MIKLVDIKKFYVGLPHQKTAVTWFGDILLKTPASAKLGLTTNASWLNLSEADLEWLQRQISLATLEKLALMWRSDKTVSEILPKYFSQRDNDILPMTTCSSSAHSMLTDYYLRLDGKPGLASDEEYLKKVFSGKYGTFGKNPSVSWEIQGRVVQSYGLKYHFEWTGDYKKLKSVLENGVACINIYHKGTTAKTRSGGHVILALDVEADGSVTVLDPYGSKPGNGYREPWHGSYKFSADEFKWRWQGAFSTILT